MPKVQDSFFRVNLSGKRTEVQPFKLIGLFTVYGVFVFIKNSVFALFSEKRKEVDLK